MVPNEKERIRALDPNDTWLFMHMVIAFWHGFGLSGGMSIKPEDVETIHYPKGPAGTRVKASVMREKLKEYLTWLESYQQKWGTGHYEDCTHAYQQVFAEAPGLEALRAGQQENGWNDIVRMIELLQV